MGAPFTKETNAIPRHEVYLQGRIATNAPARIMNDLNASHDPSLETGAPEPQRKIHVLPIEKEVFPYAAHSSPRVAPY